ncbi:hypothetical protein ACLB2K_046703 [Fragaria x ananassa]
MLGAVLAWSLRGENHLDAEASPYNLSIKKRKASEERPGAPAFDPPMPKSPPELTVFAPADEAFPYSGKPSLNLLLYQLLPVTFHLRSLKSLPFGAKIGTLLDGYSHTVTTLPSDGLVSLNNVTVTASPIFDDIKKIASFFHHIHFQHNLCEANFVANAFANLGHYCARPSF